jgi:hypothetical protein
VSSSGGLVALIGVMAAFLGKDYVYPLTLRTLLAFSVGFLLTAVVVAQASAAIPRRHRVLNLDSFQIGWLSGSSPRSDATEAFRQIAESNLLMARDIDRTNSGRRFCLTLSATCQMVGVSFLGFAFMAVVLGWL